ncbi:MAG TPA: T9SS type A sorting domain-containing protein, partial [Bacteroidetes bacterium]|nr:T9SS type A sorting domain-containing protein [Bacteroidota bacterium]
MGLYPLKPIFDLYLKNELSTISALKMKQKKIITTIAFLLLGLGGLHAQESPTATGGEATGIGGTASFSVGQVVYTTNTGINGGVMQGVQQPYEISTAVGVNEPNINLELSVYPNPTTNYLTLKVVDNVNLSFQLFDLHGKLIASAPLQSTSTVISLEAKPAAIYFLSVSKFNKTVKTFKIIKH